MPSALLARFPNQVGPCVHFIVTPSRTLYKVALFKHGYLHPFHGHEAALFKAESSCGRSVTGSAQEVATWIGCPEISPGDIWEFIFTPIKVLIFLNPEQRIMTFLDTQSLELGCRG